MNGLLKAFSDPKVIIVLLGMLGSVSAWGTKLLIEVGELRASANLTNERLHDLRVLHASEMKHMDMLLNKLMNNCGG